MSNMFSNVREPEIAINVEKSKQVAANLKVIDYNKSTSNIFNHIISFIIGFILGAVVVYVFYKIIPVSIILGLISGTVNIFIADRNTIKKRREKLRGQFLDLLEAMSVAMRAGNPPLKALESAREDLLLSYSKDSDIIVEIDIIIVSFHNAIPLSVTFNNWAKRSELEDIMSFASVYATIEGKSSRVDEIIRDVQSIISDKMRIEMEIETLMTAAKSEAYIMLLMPLAILLIIDYSGGGFMDMIYTTPTGRLVATFGLVIFVISYFLTKKFSEIEV